MKRKMLLLLILLVASLMLTIAAYGMEIENVIWVDKETGDDLNDGSSIGNPVASLEKGIQLSVENKNVIILLEGEYAAPNTMPLKDTTIRAYSGETDKYDNVQVYMDSNNLKDGIFTYNSSQVVSNLLFDHIRFTGDDLTTSEIEKNGIGINLGGINSTSKVIVQYCEFTNLKRGLYIRYTDGIQYDISNNDFNCERPIDIDSDDLISIEDNNILSTNSFAIKISNYGIIPVFIKGNKINGSDVGITGNVNNINIEDNELKVFGDAISLVKSINADISNNRIETIFGDGIYIWAEAYNIGLVNIEGNLLVYKKNDDIRGNGIGIDFSYNDSNGGVYNILNNTVLNYKKGIYLNNYDDESYQSFKVSGNSLGGNIFNLYIDQASDIEKTDISGNDWGSIDEAEVFKRVYIDMKDSGDDIKDYILIEDVFTTDFPEEVWVDDDYSEGNAGSHSFGVDGFDSIDMALALVRHGGTVHINEGEYVEEVIVDKGVKLVGVEGAILKSFDYGNLNDPSYNMRIIASSVTVEGLEFSESDMGILLEDEERYCINSVGMSSYYALLLKDKADDIIIRDCIFDNLFMGVESRTYNYKALENINITGNEIKGSKYNNMHGFFLESKIVGAEVNSNKIDLENSSGIGIRILQGKDIKLHKNEIYVGKDVDYVSYHGIVIGLLGDVTIEDNIVETQLEYGLQNNYNYKHGIDLTQNYLAEEGPFKINVFNNDVNGFTKGINLHNGYTIQEEGIYDFIIGGSIEHSNDISGNTLALVNNFREETVDATYNYWGVDDIDIPGIIMDDDDNPDYYGDVVYLPALSDAVELEDLDTGDIELTPEFSSDEYEYDASVENAVESMSVTPSAISGLIYVDGKEVDSGFSSGNIDLDEGPNSIVITVENGEQIKTYKLNIYRKMLVVEPPETPEPSKRKKKNESDIKGYKVAIARGDRVLVRYPRTKGQSGISIEWEVFEKLVEFETSLEVELPKGSLIIDRDIAEMIKRDFEKQDFRFKFIHEGEDLFKIEMEYKSKGRYLDYDGPLILKLRYSNIYENESDLGLYERVGNQWKYIGGDIDEVNDIITLEVNHLSEFRIIEKAIQLMFKDTEGHWAEKHVLEMASKGYVRGMPDGTFMPDKGIRRCEMAAILSIMADKMDMENEDADFEGFSDLNEDDWYFDQVRNVRRLNLILGYGDGRFGPELKVKREDMAVMAVRLHEMRAGQIEINESFDKTMFSDWNEISNYAEESIMKAISSGIINGKTNSTIEPGSFVTRAEVCTMFLRCLSNEI